MSLTTLPVRVAQFQVSAGASRVFLGSLRAADVLNLVVERFESGVDLSIMLSEISRSLVGSHVPERIGAFLSLTQTSEGRHIDARARGTRRTRGSGVSRRTLREKNKDGRVIYFFFFFFFFCIILPFSVKPVKPLSS